MSRVIVRTAHEIPGRPSLQLAVGDQVTVGDRDTEWPEFVFVTARHGTGWVPARHLSHPCARAVVQAAYDTTELPTEVGEVLEVIAADPVSGWLWCRSASGRNRREGWVRSGLSRRRQQPTRAGDRRASGDRTGWGSPCSIPPRAGLPGAARHRAVHPPAVGDAFPRLERRVSAVVAPSDQESYDERTSGSDISSDCRELRYGQTWRVVILVGLLDMM